MPDSGEKVTINVFAHQGSDMDLKTNKFTKKWKSNSASNSIGQPFRLTARPKNGKSRSRPATIRICICLFHG